MWKNAKIYNDGSHYIAIPHKPNLSYRPRKKKPKENRAVEPSSPAPIVVPENKEEAFEKIYDSCGNMRESTKKKHIKKQIKELFKSETEAEDFVEHKLRNKKRAYGCRKIRFLRKANLNVFNYFATFTYDSKKHTEESFKIKLTKCLRNLHGRRGWKYMGVWERSPKNKRLHFHALLFIPNGQMRGELIEVRDYDTKAKRMQTTMQNTFFNKRFGRSDFEEIDEKILRMGNTMNYLLKYLDKTNEKIVYSRGLPTFLISDVAYKDAIAKMGFYSDKIVLSDKFTCTRDGKVLGEICEEVKAKMKTCN